MSLSITSYSSPATIPQRHLKALVDAAAVLEEFGLNGLSIDDAYLRLRLRGIERAGLEGYIQARLGKTFARIPAQRWTLYRGLAQRQLVALNPDLAHLPVSRYLVACFNSETLPAMLELAGGVAGDPKFFIV